MKLTISILLLVLCSCRSSIQTSQVELTINDTTYTQKKELNVTFNTKNDTIAITNTLIVIRDIIDTIIKKDKIETMIKLKNGLFDISTKVDRDTVYLSKNVKLNTSLKSADNKYKYIYLLFYISLPLLLILCIFLVLKK